MRNSKIILKIYKNPLFKTTGQILTKFGTKHPWVEEIQIFFSNRKPWFSTKGDNKIIYCKHVKISLR